MESDRMSAQLENGSGSSTDDMESESEAFEEEVTRLREEYRRNSLVLRKQKHDIRLKREALREDREANLLLMLQLERLIAMVKEKRRRNRDMWNDLKEVVRNLSDGTISKRMLERFIQRGPRPEHFLQ
ncbi:uncharacterized protein [Panulirus ornatus]